MGAPTLPSGPPVLAKWVRERTRSTLRQMVSVVSGPGVLSLAGGLPDPGLFPTAEYAAALDHVLATDRGALQYKPPFEPLKQQIVGLMADRGVACAPDQIVLTTGAQQGIAIAVSLFLEPHGQLILEEATYPGLDEAAARLRPRLLTVPTDLASGMDVDAVEDILERGAQPAFMYAIPASHNPCGVSLSPAKRHRLVELATLYKIPIVEDDAYGLLSYEGRQEPALRALDEDGIIYVGTFSKTIAPALRLGWMVLPTELVSPATIAKEAGDLESSALTQRAVSFYLERGLFDAHLDALRRVYRGRRDALVAALEHHFPRSARWTRPSGGFFVWVELDRHIDCDALLDRAIEEEGVAFVPGSAFTPRGRTASNCMRLSFATCGPEELEEAVRRLARLLDRTASLPRFGGEGAPAAAAEHERATQQRVGVGPHEH